MSQPGQKPAASPRPRRAAAARHTQEHADGKTSGSPSKSGEKRGSDEVTTSSASTRKSSSMNPTETKVVKTEPEKKSQSTKPSVVHEKKTQEVKPKEHTEPKSVPKHSPDTGSKHTHNEKAVSRSSEQPTSEKSTIPKTKSQDTISSGGKSAVTGIAAASGKPVDKNKENKSLMSAVPVECKPSKPSRKSGMDAALDDLIDTLGEPEETKEDNTTYTGPEVLDPMSSTYIEELGKREVTLPPKYRELLNKPLGPDDAIDALSSDFTCSSPMADGKKTKKEKSTGEVLKAQSAEVIKSAAPPKEKKRKVEEDTMSDQALEALSASLGSRKPEPELDLSSIKEVNEAKAKEEKLKKCGEDEESVPPEYRLKPAMDKDGKPLLPDVEEKPKPLSESELIDELSEDLDRSKCKEKQPKPTEKTEESQAAAPTPVGAAVPRTTLCCVQSVPPPSVSAVEDRILLRSENSTVFLRRPANPGQPSTEVWSPSGIGKGMGPDDAVEALAGSLGKKEAGPEVGKPVEDKVKEEAKEDREKLGEKEETIPPDYRLEEVKDKDGKPLLPKEPKEPLPPSSEDFLLDALSKDFAVTPSTSSLQFEDAKLSAVISEVVSQTPAPTNHSAGPPPDTPQRDDKELDDALDQLSDRLGQRQPDPDENKPLEDKVKEKAKAEHRDKLGERDDTIPPEYRHLLDDDKEGKSATPPTEKPEASKKPADAQEPIDALSGDFDSCPSTTETSENTAKDKDEKTASSSKAPKNGGKAKDSAKAKEETSKRKADGKSTS
ncbi:calpastatin isoform X5 [Physeter macrocephalus]|uniref:Calpastatin n=1 Tax=Physeter macrocephalus TaxID=9755 RepID=A0A2Y9T8U5_PHYMC|nr:calpastatin isoform X5 [Physeter catodon]|eukprot:XP_023987356.1 calpastatin isoform X4 [Physeter catodon]